MNNYHRSYVVTDVIEKLARILNFGYSHSNNNYSLLRATYLIE